MAANKEAHGSSARTKEFEFDPASHGVGAVGVPSRPDVIIEIDANQSVRATVDADDRRWRMDLEITRLGTSCSAEITRLFRDGDAVDENDPPSWMESLLLEIERYLEREVP